jgi:hypothetical protein
MHPIYQFRNNDTTIFAPPRKEQEDLRGNATGN